MPNVTRKNSGLASQAASTTSRSPALPNTRVVGNLLIADVSVKATGVTITSTGAAGWTKKRQDDNGVDLTVAIFYKYIDGTEVSPTFSWTGNANCYASIAQYQDVKGSGDPFGSINYAHGEGNSNPQVPAITPTQPNNGNFARAYWNTNAYGIDYVDDEQWVLITQRLLATAILAMIEFEFDFDYTSFWLGPPTDFSLHLLGSVNWIAYQYDLIGAPQLVAGVLTVVSNTITETELSWTSGSGATGTLTQTLQRQTNGGAWEDLVGTSPHTDTGRTDLQYNYRVKYTDDLFTEYSNTVVADAMDWFLTPTDDDWFLDTANDWFFQEVDTVLDTRPYTKIEEDREIDVIREHIKQPNEASTNKDYSDGVNEVTIIRGTKITGFDNEGNAIVEESPAVDVSGDTSIYHYSVVFYSPLRPTTKQI